MSAATTARTSAPTAETRLHLMTRTTPSVLWNDSCSLQELSDSIAQNGTVGATCNPVIVLAVLKKEWPLWKDRIQELILQMKTATDGEIAWKVVEEMSQKAAALLAPAFEREKGRNGRLSIQTDPRLYRNAAAIVEQAEKFNALAPNVIVKIPATHAGIEAIEEATGRGISINHSRNDDGSVFSGNRFDPNLIFAPLFGLAYHQNFLATEFDGDINNRFAAIEFRQIDREPVENPTGSIRANQKPV